MDLIKKRVEVNLLKINRKSRVESKLMRVLQKETYESDLNSADDTRRSHDEVNIVINVIKYSIKH